MYNKEAIVDAVERAAWTFVQAALAVLLVTAQPFSKAALVAAFAAGVSALKSFVKQTL